MGDIALATRLDNERRVRTLERTRAEYAVQLDEVRVKIGRADERRKLERGNERKWNRILDQLEDSMDQLKSLIAACDGELVQLKKTTDVPPSKPAAAPAPAPDSRPKPVKSVQTEAKAKELLKKAEQKDPGALRGALEKSYGGRVQDVTLAEAAALLDEYEVLTGRSDLSALDAKRLDAIRAILPVIADRLQAWQIRWSRNRK